jgi:hypothetical protein
MPELKHTFSGGRMEKDKDERIVPNGQYRDALNISVSTSEDSDVGAAQNILGNIVVTQAAQGRTQTNTTITGLVGAEYANDNYHITQIINPQSDMLYRFVHTASETEGIWMDRIIEYDTTKALDSSWQNKEYAVVVDIFKVKASVTNWSDICTVANKSKIQVDKNLNQLRWGMRVEKEGKTEIAFIEDINYVTGDIFLDRNWNETGITTFYGDRNLNFDPNRTITGVNIIDDMLFWTDNYSEPKKIDIKKSKMGSDTSLWSTTSGLIGRYTGLPIPKIDDFNQHTVLVVLENIKYNCTVNDLIGTGCPNGGGGYTQDAIIDTTVEGCTDPDANNYGGPGNTNGISPFATIDDGSCTYDQNYYDQMQENSGFDYDAYYNIGSSVDAEDNDVG